MTNQKFDFASLSAAADLLPAKAPVTFAHAPAGLDALALADLARLLHRRTEHCVALIHVARDEQRLTALSQGLKFFAPEIEQILLPAWDCLPYDRVGPNAGVASGRLKALSRIAQLGQSGEKPGAPVIVITTVASALQRVAPRDIILERSLVARAGQLVDMDAIQRFLDANGYQRAGMVVEPGEYAVRGGILDIFAAGASTPVRLDFFGRTLETVRAFDPESQRTTQKLDEISLIQVSEVNLDEAAIGRFRQGYVGAFGAITDDDPLYASISAGRRYRGMEHWLPLFLERLTDVFALAGAAQVGFDYQAEAAATELLDQIGDHYANREGALGQAGFGAPPYKALAADQLYLSSREWSAVAAGPVLRFTPFEPAQGAGRIVDLGGREGREFAAERASDAGSVIDAAVAHIVAEQSAGRTVLVAAASVGARDRLMVLLGDHGLSATGAVDCFSELEQLGKAATGAVSATGFAAYPLERGFTTPALTVLCEPDILGER
ncbi:MAG: transcription-repair coupling factor, partial [Hyphomicrobiales bacterium]